MFDGRKIPEEFRTEYFGMQALFIMGLALLIRFLTGFDMQRDTGAALGHKPAPSPTPVPIVEPGEKAAAVVETPKTVINFLDKSIKACGILTKSAESNQLLDELAKTLVQIRDNGNYAILVTKKNPLQLQIERKMSEAEFVAHQDKANFSITKLKFERDLEFMKQSFGVPELETGILAPQR